MAFDNLITRARGKMHFHTHREVIGWEH